MGKTRSTVSAITTKIAEAATKTNESYVIVIAEVKKYLYIRKRGYVSWGFNQIRNSQTFNAYPYNPSFWRDFFAANYTMDLNYIV